MESDFIQPQTKTKRKALSLNRRIRIFRRDNYTCQLCDKYLIDVEAPGRVIDHIIPLSKGGTNDPENLWVLCYDCDRKKGADILDPEFVKSIRLKHGTLASIQRADKKKIAKAEKKAAKFNELVPFVFRKPVQIPSSKMAELNSLLVSARMLNSIFHIKHAECDQYFKTINGASLNEAQKSHEIPQTEINGALLSFIESQLLQRGLLLEITVDELRNQLLYEFIRTDEARNKLEVDMAEAAKKREIELAKQKAREEREKAERKRVREAKAKRQKEVDAIKKKPLTAKTIASLAGDYLVTTVYLNTMFPCLSTREFRKYLNEHRVPIEKITTYQRIDKYHHKVTFIDRDFFHFLKEAYSYTKRPFEFKNYLQIQKYVLQWIMDIQKRRREELEQRKKRQEEDVKRLKVEEERRKQEDVILAAPMNISDNIISEFPHGYYMSTNILTSLLENVGQKRLDSYFSKSEKLYGAPNYFKRISVGTTVSAEPLLFVDSFFLEYLKRWYGLRNIIFGLDTPMELRDEIMRRRQEWEMARMKIKQEKQAAK